MTRVHVFLAEQIRKSLFRLQSVIYVIRPTLISNTQIAIIVLIKALSIEINVSAKRRQGAKIVYICKWPAGVILRAIRVPLFFFIQFVDSKIKYFVKSSIGTYTLVGFNCASNFLCG